MEIKQMQMDKGMISILRQSCLAMIVVLLFMGALPIALAEDQTMVPPAMPLPANPPPGIVIPAPPTEAVQQVPVSLPPIPADNAPPTPQELARFETWLKNNGNTQNPMPEANAPPPMLQQPITTEPPGVIAIKSPPVVVQTKAYLPEPLNIVSKPMSLQQSQAVMLQSAPPAKPPNADSVAAFNNMMQQNVPLTPQQVVRLRQLIDVSQRAAAIPANIPPKPVSSTLLINLAPGATPPAIRLAQGYVSSLVFVDSTGAPWPIAGFEIGDPKANNIQWDGKGNVLLMQAISPYGDSNMVVRLMGLTTPVTLELVSGQRVVDFRADIHVAGLGPNAKEVSVGTILPASANQLLLDVLEGIAPGGSKLLSVHGGDCQAWLQGDKMFLRTRLTLLSPSWTGRMVSPDGMNAYEIPRTSSVLISQYGEPIELKVEGF